MEEVFSILEENNIHLVKVPANCTDHLQPIDLIVNKSVKEFMCSKFQQWYADEVQKPEAVRPRCQKHTTVNLRMLIMKPLGAHQLVSLHDYLHDKDSI